MPNLRMPAGVTPEEPPPRPSDRETTLTLIDALASRAEQALSGTEPDTGLPHPLTTDRNLGVHLGRAGEAQQLLAQDGRGGALAIIGQVRRIQVKLNEALIHCIHQLDHRDSQQRARIDELEATLAETVRRTEVLERAVLSAETAAGAQRGVPNRANSEQAR